MMRSGALNEYEATEPMSAFKWDKLIEIIKIQDVASVAARAVKNLQYEKSFNMPQKQREEVQTLANNTKSHSLNIELHSKMLNKRFKAIHAKQKNGDETVKTSLEIFNVLILNCQNLLNEGISMRLIILLGNIIRLKGNGVDYEKIDSWLEETHMQKVAQLVGSILINNFSFRKEELPFVKKIDNKASRVMMTNLKSNKPERHNKGITYFEYAPLENTSIIVNRLKGRLEVADE